MRLCRPCDADGIAGLHYPTLQHHRHHTGLADQRAVGRTTQQRRRQASLKLVELNTGIAQTGDPDDGSIAQLQLSAWRQVQQSQSAGADVFAEVRAANRKTLPGQLVEQFRMNQVHLPQVGLRRITRHTRAVLHRRAGMSVTRHTQAFEQDNLRNLALGKQMGWVLADRNNVHGGKLTGGQGMAVTEL